MLWNPCNVYSPVSLKKEIPLAESAALPAALSPGTLPASVKSPGPTSKSQADGSVARTGILRDEEGVLFLRKSQNAGSM